jgi:hypothetical protein
MTPPTPDRICAAVTAMLEGSGLHIEQRPLELVITNPSGPEKGQVVISLDEGYVTWERTEISYWGHLEGIPSQDQDAHTIPASQIIQALTDRLYPASTTDQR